MLHALFKRFAATGLTLWVLSVLLFAMVRLVPGDTATALLGMQQNEQTLATLREQLALDEPLPIQYLAWAKAALQGDWGQSVRGVPVGDLLGQALPVTLELAGLAFLIGVVLGVLGGTLAACKHRSWWDGLVSGFCVLGLSVPGFWAGTLLILLFALQWHWLPSGRLPSFAHNPIEHVRHLVMPVAALGLAVTAVIARATRASVLETMQSDCIRTAKAKGLPTHTLMVKHVLRQACLPVIPLAGLQAGYLLGGSVVIEAVFSIQGIGSVVLQALGQRDYPTLQAGILWIGAVFLLVNLLADGLVLLLNPAASRRASATPNSKPSQSTNGGGQP